MKTILMNLLADPVVWCVLFSLVFILIGIIVQKTATKKDDEIYAQVLKYINIAFNVAEKAIPDGTTGKLAKIDIALKDFNDRYASRFGTDAPPDVLDKAKAEWAILAQEIKKVQA